MKKTSLAIFAVLLSCFFALGYLVYRVTTKEDSYTKIIFFADSASYGEDNKFYNNCWNSVRHFSLKVPVEAYANPEKLSVTKCLEKIMQEKPGLLVFSNEDSQNDGLDELIKANPKTQFVLIDKRHTIDAPNYRYMLIDVQEASMLAGYVAAKTTKTNRIGLIGGKDIPAIDAFKYGFMAGIQYGAREMKKNIDFEAAYIGDFSDEKKGADLAQKLYIHNCDIIFQVAGQAGLGVIQEAEKEEHWVIGVDENQYNLSPKAVLTSVIKDWDLAIFDLINDYLHNNLLPVEKSAVKLNLAGNYCRLPYINPNIPYEIKKDTDNLADLITSGSISAPYDQITYDIFLESLVRERGGIL